MSSTGWLSNMSGLLPNLLATVVLAIVVGLIAAPRLRLSRIAAVCWLLCLSAPVALTWTKADVDQQQAGCAWSTGWWELNQFFTDVDIVPNIVLLIPAGAAAAVFPRGPRRWSALLVALMVPLIIEAGQALMPWLHRTCQVGDIGNNALGVLIGFVVAVAVRAAWEATGKPKVRPKHGRR